MSANIKRIATDLGLPKASIDKIMKDPQAASKLADLSSSIAKGRGENAWNAVLCGNISCAAAEDLAAKKGLPGKRPVKRIR